MPSAYLATGELSAYGVPGATNAQITGASALLDAYLRRKEGLQWSPDAAGNPTYMAGLSPSFTIKATAGFGPGVNVTVPVAYAQGMLSTAGSVGDVVIIDQADITKTEACVIASVTAGAVVLAKVINAHLATATMDFGMVIREQRALPKGRSITRVASCPVVRLLSGVGSYRYGRRTNQIASGHDQGLLHMMAPFGGPPPWTPFDVTQADFDPVTGEVWIPVGTFLANYSDVRLFYVAGYSQANIPAAIKSATAAAITAGLNVADLAGGMKLAKAGDTTIERFANSALDDDLRMQIDGYKAKMIV